MVIEISSGNYEYAASPESIGFTPILQWRWGVGFMSYFYFVFLVRKKLGFTLLAPVRAAMVRTARRRG